MMGHANAAMTLNTYASADAEAKKRGAAIVEQTYQKEVSAHANDGEVLNMPLTGTDGE